MQYKRYSCDILIWYFHTTFFGIIMSEKPRGVHRRASCCFILWAPRPLVGIFSHLATGDLQPGWAQCAGVLFAGTIICMQCGINWILNTAWLSYFKTKLKIIRIPCVNALIASQVIIYDISIDWSLCWKCLIGLDGKVTLMPINNSRTCSFSRIAFLSRSMRSWPDLAGTQQHASVICILPLYYASGKTIFSYTGWLS